MEIKMGDRSTLSVFLWPSLGIWSVQVRVVTLEGKKERCTWNLKNAPHTSCLAPDMKGFVNFIGCDSSILIML